LAVLNRFYKEAECVDEINRLCIWTAQTSHVLLMWVYSFIKYL